MRGLAGDKMVLEHGEDRSTISFGDTGTGRACGTCTLCCKLLPVPGPPLHKPAEVCAASTSRAARAAPSMRSGRCPAGCSPVGGWPIATRPECPGRIAVVAYVIDIKDDYVEAVDKETGARQRFGVVQVWSIRAFRDAHRDPPLRAYMRRMAERHGYATIVRYSNREAFTIWPPPLCHDGQWHEVAGELVKWTRLMRR